MLAIKNLKKLYGKTLALDGIDLEIPEGNIFAFIGPNGAGKTTTIKILATLLLPSAGEIHVKGIDLLREPNKIKKIIGYIPDTPFLYDKLSGREFLQFVASLFSVERKTFNIKFSELDEYLSFGEWIDDLVESYSHGMKQRVAIASSLIHDPYLLLIDEPMVGLDPLSAKKVKDLFKEYASRGNIIFLSTHTLSLAEDIADIVGVINKGRLIRKGFTEDLKSKKESNLEEIFLKMIAEQT
ncbi:ABC transporter ATP-binding protein [candidate division WOR-3 bacterium]|nr:ABC transporter ATP-binding protein [candidate division WOR-3 bacterium]